MKKNSNPQMIRERVNIDTNENNHHILNLNDKDFGDMSDSDGITTSNNDYSNNKNHNINDCTKMAGDVIHNFQKENIANIHNSHQKLVVNRASNNRQSKSMMDKTLGETLEKAQKITLNTNSNLRMSPPQNFKETRTTTPSIASQMTLMYNNECYTNNQNIPQSTTSATQLINNQKDSYLTLQPGTVNYVQEPLTNVANQNIPQQNLPYPNSPSQQVNNVQSIPQNYNMSHPMKPVNQVNASKGSPLIDSSDYANKININSGLTQSSPSQNGRLFSMFPMEYNENDHKGNQMLTNNVRHVESVQQQVEPSNENNVINAGNGVGYRSGSPNLNNVRNPKKGNELNKFFKDIDKKKHSHSSNKQNMHMNGGMRR